MSSISTPSQGDLFLWLEAQPWVPDVGDLVLLRPDGHRGSFASAAELAMPLRVARDGGDVDGHRMVWVTPTAPLHVRTRRDGRQFIERPTSQSPIRAEDLMPFAGELPPEPEAKRRRAA